MLQRARDSAQQELVAQLRATLAELSESNDELRAASAARAAESEVLSPVLTQQLQAEVASLRARVSMLTFDFEVSSPSRAAQVSTAVPWGVLLPAVRLQNQSARLRQELREASSREASADARAAGNVSLCGGVRSLMFLCPRGSVPHPSVHCRGRGASRAVASRGGGRARALAR